MMGQWTWGTIVDAPSAGIKFLCFVEPKSVPCPAWQWKHWGCWATEHPALWRRSFGVLRLARGFFGSMSPCQRIIPSKWSFFLLGTPIELPCLIGIPNSTSQCAEELCCWVQGVHIWETEWVTEAREEKARLQDRGRLWWAVNSKHHCLQAEWNFRWFHWDNQLWGTSHQSCATKKPLVHIGSILAQPLPLIDPYCTKGQNYERNVLNVLAQILHLSPFGDLILASVILLRLHVCPGDHPLLRGFSITSSLSFHMVFVFELPNFCWQHPDLPGSKSFVFRQWLGNARDGFGRQTWPDGASNWMKSCGKSLWPVVQSHAKSFDQFPSKLIKLGGKF